jgi:hypothetical protein
MGGDEGRVGHGLRTLEVQVRTRKVRVQSGG